MLLRGLLLLLLVGQLPGGLSAFVATIDLLFMVPFVLLFTVFACLHFFLLWGYTLPDKQSFSALRVCLIFIDFIRYGCREFLLTTRANFG